MDKNIVEEERRALVGCDTRKHLSLGNTRFREALAWCEEQGVRLPFGAAGQREHRRD